MKISPSYLLIILAALLWISSIFCNFFLKDILCIFPQPLFHMMSMLAVIYHQLVPSLSKCVPSLRLSKFAAPTKIWDVYYEFHFLIYLRIFYYLLSSHFYLPLKIHLINTALILLFVIKYQCHKVNQTRDTFTSLFCHWIRGRDLVLKNLQSM